MRKDASTGGRGRWLLSAALASAACAAGGGGGTGPSDTPPPPVTSVSSWAGLARSSATLSGPTASSTTTFEGSVTWQKVENPDPSIAPTRPGMVLYSISSGLVHVAYRATRTNTSAGVQCSDEGAVDVPFDPSNPLRIRLNTSIYLEPDGHYAGAIYAFDVPVRIAFTCTTGASGSFAATLRVSLSITGNVTASRRIQGEMVPETVGGETTTGSWDFAPR